MDQAQSHTQAKSFVRVVDVDPTINVSLPYKTADNVCQQPLYSPHAEAYLRYPVALALSQANQYFRQYGLIINIWDAYRPFSVQKQIWEHFPDEQYVLRPIEQDGVLLQGSRHSRGVAVDITLLEAQSLQPLIMPTAFDTFDERAHRDYMDLPQKAIENREFLSGIMNQCGFIGLPTEWWHFDWQHWELFALCDHPL